MPKREADDEVISRVKLVKKPKVPPKGEIAPFVFEFLSGLAENNNRDWFQMHRPEYEASKECFINFVSLLLPRLASVDPTVDEVEPKAALFRINRDIRFTSDKSPYKLHLSAGFGRGGKKPDLAGYYLQIQPGATMVACGIWQPPAPVLLQVRNGISSQAELFKESLETPLMKQLFEEAGTALLDRPSVDRLKMCPKGFDKQDPMLETLKLKTFAVAKKFTDEQVLKPDFMQVVLMHLEAMCPFVQVINSFIES
ncbi:hypothetical protein EDD86DRAFT_1557 [Gorgonomyces haynaldii]|nr:hypothetical protein EDD86DRAFT_1557 [Gorgonomyces haynaldii]